MSSPWSLFPSGSTDRDAQNSEETTKCNTWARNGGTQKVPIKRIKGTHPNVAEASLHELEWDAEWWLWMIKHQTSERLTLLLTLYSYILAGWTTRQTNAQTRRATRTNSKDAFINTKSILFGHCCMNTDLDFNFKALKELKQSRHLCWAFYIIFNVYLLFCIMPLLFYHTSLTLPLWVPFYPPSVFDFYWLIGCTWCWCNLTLNLKQQNNLQVSAQQLIFNMKSISQLLILHTERVFFYIFSQDFCQIYLKFLAFLLKFVVLYIKFFHVFCHLSASWSISFCEICHHVLQKKS